MAQKHARSLALKVAAIMAVLFGLLTIFAGGKALFGGEEARAAVGDAVLFVLWFNFSAGFAYVIAGAGLLGRKSWAVWLSAFIVLVTAVTFAAFGLHVVQGGAYEMRTIGAMTLRIAVWLAITIVAMRKVGWR